MPDSPTPAESEARRIGECIAREIWGNPIGALTREQMVERYAEMFGRHAAALIAERDGLLAGIRKHRDTRGDDRCHQDDHDLYILTPEGDTRPPQDTAVTIENCQRYIKSRHDPRITYVSPEREIERLRAEAKAMGCRVDDLLER